MKTPSGWARATAYVQGSPVFGRTESIADILRNELLELALWREARTEIMRDHAMCLAAIAGGETNAEARKEDVDAFWKAWNKYLALRFPFDETLKEREVEDIKKYMAEHWDDRPLAVTPLPAAGRHRRASQIVPQMPKRQNRRHPRGPGGWRRS